MPRWRIALFQSIFCPAIGVIHLPSYCGLGFTLSNVHEVCPRAHRRRPAGSGVACSDRLCGPGRSLPLHDVAADGRSEGEMQGTSQAQILTLGVG